MRTLGEEPRIEKVLIQHLCAQTGTEDARTQGHELPEESSVEAPEQFGDPRKRHWSVTTCWEDRGHQPHPGEEGELLQ